jgi:hypothetical protein
MKVYKEGYKRKEERKHGGFYIKTKYSNKKESTLDNYLNFTHSIIDILNQPHKILDE